MLWGQYHKTDELQCYFGLLHAGQQLDKMRPYFQNLPLTLVDSLMFEKFKKTENDMDSKFTKKEVENKVVSYISVDMKIY